MRSQRLPFHRKGLFSLLSVLATLLLGGEASAQTLYGAATNSASGGQPRPSSLYTIDPQTGTATEVGPIGFNNVTGLAFLPDGRLVGSANGDNEFVDNTALLIEIDTATGQGTLIDVIDDNVNGECGRMPDITYDLTRNTLFGYSDSCDTLEGLYTIDPVTGAGTPPANPSGFDDGGNGLAAHPVTGTIYGTPIDSDGLITIDPATGVATLIPASAGNGVNAVNALDFHPVTLQLYGSFRDFDGNDDSFLVTINTEDGVVTTVGPTILGLDAIAFSRFCGDGQPAFNEECDDGNDVNGDGCENDCTLSLCGNGTVDSGEECDDGNFAAGDGCDALCLLEAVCGNGTQDPGEQCDDGNSVDGDLCTNLCALNPAINGGGCALSVPRAAHGLPSFSAALGVLGLLILGLRVRAGR